MSDILIKGMEMPANEPLIVKINPDGSVSKLWRDVFLEYANCKAVHVPPHGDLIDRSALTETTDGIWDCNDLYFQPNDHICDPEDCKGCKWRETWDCFRRMVKHAPTIIPAEGGKT